MEGFIVLALGLLVFGVVASVLPILPGGLLSIAGVYVYWWGTGYTEPNVWLLAALTAVGVTVLVADWFGGAIGASVGGADLQTVLVAALVGFVLLVLSGPLGLLVGFVGTVFLVERYRGEDTATSLRSATYATVGILASAVVQVLLTGSMLVVMVVVVFA